MTVFKLLWTYPCDAKTESEHQCLHKAHKKGCKKSVRYFEHLLVQISKVLNTLHSHLSTYSMDLIQVEVSVTSSRKTRNIWVSPRWGSEWHSHIIQVMVPHNITTLHCGTVTFTSDFRPRGFPIVQIERPRWSMTWRWQWRQAARGPQNNSTSFSGTIIE